MLRTSVLAIVTIAATLMGGTAAAQGKSANNSGSNKGRGHQPGGGSGPAAPTAITPSPATASLSTWIDDATVPAPGTAWVSLSFGEWNSDAGRDVEAPVPAFAAGLAPHVGVGANLPIDNFRDSTGAMTTSVGDVSLFAKLGLVDPASHTVGAAVIPIIQISPDGLGGRDVSWALPVSLEVRGAHGRIYGTGGYFSSGSVFAAGAVEFRVVPRFTLIGRLGQTYAVGSNTVPAGQSSHRTDISGGFALLMSPRAALFASIGHAYSGDPTADGGPWIAGGIIIRTR